MSKCSQDLGSLIVLFLFISLNVSCFIFVSTVCHYTDLVSKCYLVIAVLYAMLLCFKHSAFNVSCFPIQLQHLTYQRLRLKKRKLTFQQN